MLIRVHLPLLSSYACEHPPDRFWEIWWQKAIAPSPYKKRGVTPEFQKAAPSWPWLELASTRVS